ncbi:MAG: hypothetical protein QOJ16_1465 [Acidobacteriota bacterium]|nr:hypothetical protein [Acidobacteriota bacterium]
MIILDSLLTGGLRFVFDQIAAAVEREMDDESLLKEELLTAQMRLELGEIDDDEFALIEAEILPRLREIRQRRQGETAAASPSGGGRVVGVEVNFGGDDDRGGGS